MDSGDSSEIQLLFLNTGKYRENAKWQVHETEVRQVVLHSLQRGLKGKVVKMARTPMTIQPLKHIQHSHHDCHHSGATTVTSPT